MEIFVNNKVVKVFFICTIVVVCMVGHLKASNKEDTQPKHTNVVLVGATGDLAKKYLWNSLFELFKLNYKKGEHQFSIYAATRAPPDEGRGALSQILLNNVKCVDDKCREKKKAFVEATQYVQLKTDKHYEDLGQLIHDNTLAFYGNEASQLSYEVGRLIYLSIPPSVYKRTVMLADKYLRPQLGRPWFRVVLEKPFGHDRKSAASLAEELAKYLSEEEIYRIDHYLGKEIVKLILPFRQVNKNLYGSLWNRHHVERIEVVMKETVDVNERTIFYEEVGVLRDVMQNHLTELLALVTMKLPDNTGNITQILNAKQKVLSQVSPVDRSNILIGQYESYEAEAVAERQDGNFTSRIPTFAATLLKMSGPWRGVPVIVMSGKKLEEKSSYVRIVFKSDRVCVSSKLPCNPTKQIIFHIGGDVPQHPPMILVSRSLAKPRNFPAWRKETITTNAQLYGHPAGEFYQLMPSSGVDCAYCSLLSAVYQGERHMFTTTDTLLAAWDIWNPVLNIEEHVQPRIYLGGHADIQLLNFRVTGSGLQYEEEVDDLRQEVVQVDEEMKIAQIPGTFLGSSLVSGNTDDTLDRLAASIEAAAVQAIQQRGVFHLALSGGNSPKKLLQVLVNRYVGFPWDLTHIWQVDERCVPAEHDLSNLNTIDKHLLQHISIVHSHVHAMPVHIYTEPCNSHDGGDNMYEQRMRRALNNTGSMLDFVLLGVGPDGHTASLFPNITELKYNTTDDPWVTYTEAGDQYAARMRMSLTYTAINNARDIGVLVLGASKHSLLVTLEASTDQASVPILGVRPTQGNMTWYIDHDAIMAAPTQGS